MSDLVLETAYQNYLESELASKSTERLIAVLAQYGLELEANALKVYLMEGSGTHFSAVGLSTNCLCTISLDLPPNAKPGDLWFDPVELNFATLIPNPEGVSHHVKSWMSNHPVYVWQYRAFLNLIKIDKKIEVFNSPEDYLKSSRIENQESLSYITDLYHDEAVAYSSWMRKSLSGQGVLKAARAYLGSQELEKFLPSTLKFWESSDVEEWYRTAVGLNSLDRSFSLDYNDILEENFDKLDKKTDRMLYEEWDRRKFIGMMTIVPVFCGLGKDNTASSFYYEFLNRSPRPGFQAPTPIQV
jgi:hypothetical protein